MGNTASGELKWRTDFVNTEARKHGTSTTFYISSHLNAAGNQGKWLGARGWSAYTSPGKTTSDLLAQFLYKAAESGLTEYKKIGTWNKPQKPIRTDFSDGDPDMEANLYVLKNTICPAVLVENMFQDNRDDYEYLMSDLGKHELQRLYVEGILWFLENK
jgi:N-acetylmuramoyl-L-alanine amidase